MVQERIVLQFGELANASFIHYWNALAQEETEDDNGYSVKRAMIYSQPLPLRGILQATTLNSPTTMDSTSPNVLQQQLTGHWTDHNLFYDFPSHQYRESFLFPSHQSRESSLSTFYFDSEWSGSIEEYVEEDVRRMAEQCDALGGLVLAGPQTGAFGASLLHASSFLRDECPSQSQLWLSFECDLLVQAPSQHSWSPLPSGLEESFAFALQNLMLKDGSKCTAVPIRCSGLPEPFASPSAYPRAMSQVLRDVLGRKQEFGVRGFASLQAGTLNLTSGIRTSKSASASVDVTPIATPMASTTPSAILFKDPQYFAQKAHHSLTLFTKHPRSLPRLLDSQDISDELIEGLHQLMD